MHAALMALALIAFQLGDAQQDLGADAPITPTTDADQAATGTDGLAGDGVPDDNVPDSADPAADPQSEITIAPETPPPALADGAPPPAADSAAPADATATELPAAAAAAADDPGAGQPDPAAATETQAAPAAPKPADLMRALLTTPPTGQLAGIPLSLGAALRDAATRSAQTDRAQAYWDLTAAVAQYYLAVLEQGELAQLQQGVASPSAAWNDAATEAARRVELTRQSAVASQLRLYRLLGASAGVSLPLPADAPHCGRYSTRYEEVFAGRQDPGAQQLNDLLPLMHGELSAAASLVSQAHAWLQFVAEHRDPATDGVGVLRSYQLMTERRRMFIDAVRQYNNHIAQYAELAAPDQIGPDRLVAMLIRVSNPEPAASKPDPAVEPAAAFEPADQEDNQDFDATGASLNNNRPAERTFARRPLDFLRKRERSIVTARRLLRLPFRDRERD